jgi:hypothetical protein
VVVVVAKSEEKENMDKIYKMKIKFFPLYWMLKL